MSKPGRNELYHCGSGKKYKKRCLDKDIETGRQVKYNRYNPPHDPNAPKVSAAFLMAVASDLGIRGY